MRVQFADDMAVTSERDGRLAVATVTAQVLDKDGKVIAERPVTARVNPLLGTQEDKRTPMYRRAEDPNKPSEVIGEKPPRKAADARLAELLQEEADAFLAETIAAASETDELSALGGRVQALLAVKPDRVEVSR